MNTTGLRPRLHHFGISVPDLDETATWYREKLGFERDDRYDIQNPHLDARVAFPELGDFRVELFEVQGAQALPGARRVPFTDLGVHGLKHVALKVDDIAAARAALQALRAPRPLKVGFRLGFSPRAQRTALLPASWGQGDHTSSTRRNA